MVQKNRSKASTIPSRFLNLPPRLPIGHFPSLSKQVQSMGEDPGTFPKRPANPSLTSTHMSRMHCQYFENSDNLFSNEQVALFGFSLPSRQEGGKTFIWSASFHIERREEKYSHYNSRFGFQMIRVRMSHSEGKACNRGESTVFQWV